MHFHGIKVDKAFECHATIQSKNGRSAQIITSQRTQCNTLLIIYAFFGKLKDFKGIAMRSVETGGNCRILIYAFDADIDS